MRKTNIRKLVLFSLIVVVVSINFLIIYLIASKNIALAPSDSAAGVESKLKLSLVSNITPSNLQIGEQFTVATTVENPVNTNIAELVLTYDPAILSAEEIVEDSDVLALNKEINNTTGLITVDIAHAGEGVFPENTTLLLFRFTLISKLKSSTKVALAEGTTLGIPNRLEAKNFDTLTLTFDSTFNARN